MDCVPWLAILEKCKHLEVYRILNILYTTFTAFLFLSLISFGLYYAVRVRKANAAIVLLIHLIASNTFLLIFDILRLNKAEPWKMALTENLGMTLTISSICYVVNVWINMTKEGMLVNERHLQNVWFWALSAPIYIISSTCFSVAGSIKHYLIYFRLTVAIYALYVLYLIALLSLFMIKRVNELPFTLSIIAICVLSFIFAIFHCVYLDRIEASLATHVFWSMYRFMAHLYVVLWIFKIWMSMRKKVKTPKLVRIESKYSKSGSV